MRKGKRRHLTYIGGRNEASGEVNITKATGGGWGGEGGRC